MSARGLLRRETKYGVWKESRPLRPSRVYFGTEGKPYRYFPNSWWLEAQERSELEPVKLHEYDGRTWWRFKGEIFTEASQLSAEDVQALALQLRRDDEKTLARAHAEMRGEAAAARPREPIAESVRHEVWRRDGGRCVDCGSKENLEFDHIIPWSEGGANTARNLELRCEACNRKKGASI
jgi:hypothetical protein